MRKSSTGSRVSFSTTRGWMRSASAASRSNTRASAAASGACSRSARSAKAPSFCTASALNRCAPPYTVWTGWRCGESPGNCSAARVFALSSGSTNELSALSGIVVSAMTRGVYPRSAEAFARQSEPGEQTWIRMRGVETAQPDVARDRERFIAMLSRVVAGLLDRHPHQCVADLDFVARLDADAAWIARHGHHRIAAHHSGAARAAFVEQAILGARFVVLQPRVGAAHGAIAIVECDVIPPHAPFGVGRFFGA